MSRKFTVLGSNASVLAIVTAGLVSSGFARADGPVLHDLGAIGTSVEAKAVSADGSTVVGYYAGPHAFKWTAAGGLVDLGTLPDSSFSWAYAVNADGSVVCGQGTTPSLANRAFRWTASTGMQNLGTLPSGTSSSVSACNGQGTVVVGISSNGQTSEPWPMSDEHACFWTMGGVVDLLTLGGNHASATATDASGSVIGGWSFTTIGATHAFRWTEGTGMVDLTPGSSSSSQVNGMSADGSVLTGFITVASNHHAFRWTAATGLVDLGEFQGRDSTGVALTADGSMIVGYGNINNALFWTAERGLVGLQQELVGRGADVTEGGTATWILRQPTAVSADGGTIVGWGSRNGQRRAWMVTGFVTPSCGPADIGVQGGLPGHDGVLDNNDFIAFISDFFANNPVADFGTQGGLAGSDGQFDNNDFIAFINAFFAGC